CGELTLIRRQAWYGIFRDVGSQSSCRGSGRGRGTSRGSVGSRHRSLTRKWSRFLKWLLPREDGPGKSDQGFRDSVYDHPRNAVLRVCEVHSPIRDRPSNSSVTTDPYP